MAGGLMWLIKSSHVDVDALATTDNGTDVVDRANGHAFKP